MKFLALFLSLIVVVLTVTPCCALEEPDYHVHETRISKTNGCNEQSADCCSTCSPFYVCCSGAGLLFSATLNLHPLFQPELMQHGAGYIPSTLPLVSLAIWQPPQLV
ncbi:hypothetical protein [Pedobacter sp. SYP-B3415]|uniref:hypothetical protein n=1 Tax=Pedobacter sp. SYP-B3415 TaxID=2496641 RepID=UPI00101C7E0C|nr:hypothetical protein [Pedobacter sp. SYP-B3415]